MNRQNRRSSQNGQQRRLRQRHIHCPRRPCGHVSTLQWVSLIIPAAFVFAVLMEPTACGQGQNAEGPVFVRNLAAEDTEAGHGHPTWIPLALDGRGSGEGSSGPGRSILELFRSSEVVQMYHIQATAILYEQGGLDHDMSFALTGVAFYSIENPETKVSMAYYPTNMTMSLLPVISEDGRELHWENQEASLGYVMDIDQALVLASLDNSRFVVDEHNLVRKSLLCLFVAGLSVVMSKIVPETYPIFDEWEHLLAKEA